MARVLRQRVNFDTEAEDILQDSLVRASGAVCKRSIEHEEENHCSLRQEAGRDGRKPQPPLLPLGSARRWRRSFQPRSGERGILLSDV